MSEFIQPLIQPAIMTALDAVMGPDPEIDETTQTIGVKRARTDGQIEHTNESNPIVSDPVQGLLSDHDKLGRPLLSGATSMKTQLYQLRSLMWMVCQPYMLHAGYINRVTGQGKYKLNCAPGLGSVEQPVHIWELNRQISYQGNIGFYMRHDGAWEFLNNTEQGVYDMFGTNRNLVPTDPTKGFAAAEPMSMLESLNIDLNFRGRTNRPTKYTVKLVTDFVPHAQPQADNGTGDDVQDNTWELYVHNLLGRLTYNPIVRHYTHKHAYRNPFKTLYHKDIYIGENEAGEDAQLSRPLTIKYNVNKLYDFWHWKHDNAPSVDQDHGSTRGMQEYTGVNPKTADHRVSPAQRMYLMVYATDYMNTGTSADAPSYDCRIYSKWLSPAHQSKQG